MTPIVVRFSVPWVHGWQRAGVNTRTGEHYTRAQTEADEAEIGMRYKAACRKKYGEVLKAPEHVPVSVIVDAYAKRPKRTPKYVPKWLLPRIPFTTKPDADNVSKLIDGLNGIAWHDDAQVVNLTVHKRSRESTKEDRTTFTVIWMEEQE